MDELSKLSALSGKYFYKRKTNTDFMRQALEGLKANDEMSILAVLNELSSELSMANDSAAEDPRINPLIKELLTLFDKYAMLPDISMSSLTCLNNLLDINPRSTSAIVKCHGVEKLVSLTQNLDYIDCAEASIKALEKMSGENPFVLLENDAFASILSFIDFFDLNLRRTALKACLNMAKVVNNMDYVKRFIIPAVPSLTNLAKMTGNSEIEKNILDLALQCFCHIVLGMKNYTLASSGNNLCNSFIQYGLLDNLFQIFINFIKVEQGMIMKPGEENILEENANNVSVSVDTLKNILKLFEAFCWMSPDITMLIINMNILELIYSILSNEIGINVNNSARKLSSNSYSMYNELFALLTSFFPGKKSKMDRIMSPKSKGFFIYFSENILSLLINNIVHIPSSSTMVSIIKLIEMYCQNSPAEYIRTYINQTHLSNIVGKMLDSKDSEYIQEVFTLVELIMTRVPDHFFISFLREGVVDNIKCLMKVDENQLYILKDNLTSQASKNLGMVSNNNIYNDDVLEDEYFDDDELIKDYADPNVQNEKATSTFSNKGKVKDNDDIIFVKPSGIVATNKLPIVQGIHQKAQDLVDKFFKEEDINSLLIQTNSKVNPIEILQKLIEFKNILKFSQKISVNTLSDIISIIIQNQITFFEIEKSEIVLYLCKFIDENFLINYENTFENDKPQEKDKSSQCIAPSTVSTNITGNHDPNIVNHMKMLFEATNNEPELMVGLIKTFQQCISSMNCFKLFLYDYGSSKNAAHLFLSGLSANPSSLSKFGEMKRHQRIKMKFVFVPSDMSLKNENPAYQQIFEYFLSKSHLSLCFDQNETFENIKETLVYYPNKHADSRAFVDLPERGNRSGNYDEDIFNALKEKSDSEEDMQFTGILLQKLIDQKKSMEKMNSNSNSSNTNMVTEPSHTVMNTTTTANVIPLISNEDFAAMITNLDVVFSIDYANMSQKLLIKNNWTVGEFLKEMKNTLKRTEFLHFCIEIKVNFDIIRSLCANPVPYVDSDVTMSFDQSSDITSILVEPNISSIEKGDYEDILFLHFYRQTIINNKSLYSIKRASPFFFLISTIELCTKHFGNFFKIQESPSYQNFENLKMTSLLFKQMKDPYAISSMSIPSWCKELSESYPYLTGFSSRYLLFKISSFDMKRSIANLYVYLRNFMGEKILEDKALTSIGTSCKRTKYQVERENILQDSMKMMKELGSYSGYVEIEYQNETGTGIGPTLEFYTLFTEEMRKLHHLWYKTEDLSLFPAPCFNLSPEELENKKMIFTTLGYVLARGLYDDRIIEFPLNSLFWDLVLDRPLNFEGIGKIDPHLFKAVNELREIAAEKKKMKDNIYDIKYHGRSLNDLDLYFTLPGYNGIPLKRGGEDILLTIDNLEEYLALIFEKLIVSGPLPFIEAFKSGFNKIFSISSLKCFSSIELEEIICGSDDKSRDNWSYENLINNILPLHGFNQDSLIFKGLIEILMSMSNSQRKKFLLFVTGAPRLPLGGFKNLYPKLTVVMFQHENKYESPETYLPSVMTCQNYLKIPNYSNVKILREKIFLAMEEGTNAFHLS